MCEYTIHDKIPFAGLKRVKKFDAPLEHDAITAETFAKNRSSIKLELRLCESTF